MKIALCSDEPYSVHQTIRQEVLARGHECRTFGAFESGQEQPWAQVAAQAAQAVASGDCEQGIFLCWSGTGISMAANKVAGIRAALCFDPPTARAARQWNDANVLCLSNRTLSDDVAREILESWFESEPLPSGQEGIRILKELDLSTRP